MSSVKRPSLSNGNPFFKWCSTCDTCKTPETRVSSRPRDKVLQLLEINSNSHTVVSLNLKMYIWRKKFQGEENGRKETQITLSPFLVFLITLHFLIRNLRNKLVRIKGGSRSGRGGYLEKKQPRKMRSAVCFAGSKEAPPDHRAAQNIAPCCVRKTSSLNAGRASIAKGDGKSSPARQNTKSLKRRGEHST